MWKKYQDSHSRSSLQRVRQMINKPNETQPWQNRRNLNSVPHDQPVSDPDVDNRKHYFGPAKFYCVEIACAPCGAAIAWTKFDRSESPTKILKFLEDIFPTEDSKPSYICIDKACQVLRTAIVNRSFDTIWPNTRFIVDTYHYNNHKRSDDLCKSWCNPTPDNDSNPNYLNLITVERDKNGILQAKRAFNTQASEQLNSWIASFNSILKRMTIHNFNWFLHVMLFLHTKRVIQRQKERQERAERSDQANPDENSDDEEDLDNDENEEAFDTDHEV
jgi:hypothetical protein